MATNAYGYNYDEKKERPKNPPQQESSQQQGSTQLPKHQVDQSKPSSPYQINTSSSQQPQFDQQSENIIPDYEEEPQDQIMTEDQAKQYVDLDGSDQAEPVPASQQALDKYVGNEPIESPGEINPEDLELANLANKAEKEPEEELIQEVPEEDDSGYSDEIEELLARLQGDEFSFDPIQEKLEESRDADLQALYESMESRGLGSSGMESSMAADIFRKSGLDISNAMEEFKNADWQRKNEILQELLGERARTEGMAHETEMMISQQEHEAKMQDDEQMFNEWMAQGTWDHEEAMTNLAFALQEASKDNDVDRQRRLAEMVLEMERRRLMGDDFNPEMGMAELELLNDLLRSDKFKLDDNTRELLEDLLKAYGYDVDTMVPPPGDRRGDIVDPGDSYLKADGFDENDGFDDGEFEAWLDSVESSPGGGSIWDTLSQQERDLIASNDIGASVDIGGQTWVRTKNGWENANDLDASDLFRALGSTGDKQAEGDNVIRAVMENKSKEEIQSMILEMLEGQKTNYYGLNMDRLEDLLAMYEDMYGESLFAN